MKKNTAIFSLVIIVIALVLMQLKTCKRVTDNQKLYNAISDTLTTYRNERGLVESYIDLIETNNEKQFLKLKTNDSTIKWLQTTVRHYKGKLNTALIANVNTTSEGGLKTIKITQTDTLTIDSIKYVFPEYAVDWSNKWEVGSIRANRDSIFRNIKIKNEYEFTIGKQKNGWFKKRESEVKLVNLNPNTVTKELRAFNISTKPKRWVFVLQVGYGITSELKPTTYAGAGLGFVLFQIK